MARMARRVVPGVAHPVTQRGCDTHRGGLVKDAEQAFNTMRPVELNPARAGMVRCPWRFPCSSAAAHCGKAASNALLDLSAWRETMPPEDWLDPLSGDNFLSGLEVLTNRRLRPHPIGCQTGWRKEKAVKKRKKKERNCGKEGKR